MSIVWNNITDAEGGLSVRNKLNNVIASLVGFANDPAEENDQSKWEADGVDDIKPKDGKGITIPSLEAASNFRVATDGKVYIDDLATIAPVPLLIGTDGRLRTAATVDTYTLTITVTTSGLGASISGTVWITGNGFMQSKAFTGGECVISDIPNGTYNYTILTEQYQPYSDEVTVSGNTSITATLTSQFGQDPDDVIEGRTGELILADTASNLTLAKPVAVVERGVNYSLTLPDAGDSQTVEMSARKAQTGGALTLVANGGFYMDGESGDVLTTTVKGAWVKVKAIEIGGVQKWAVIQDSGDWTLDTI